ncbi:septation protein IspZ [uncultured Ruminobacter sp.]|uniref:septation protein IspZ n=1 Tax=uncultured Ruminobacter sp. TaxID=538947 RepID=UPI0025DAB88C|nr:septation protein IspZ [uncultured Ruminobacter sp.]
MKLLLNLLPAICFFATYKFSDHNLIYATIAVVISSVITLGGSWILQGKITRIQIVVILTLLVFAIPTIMVKDPSFIKWKVSVVNCVIASGLLICQFGFGTYICIYNTRTHHKRSGLVCDIHARRGSIDFTGYIRIFDFKFLCAEL